MSRKIQIYLNDKDEKLFDQRLVDAVTTTRRPIGVSELVVAHFKKACEKPICEVVA